MIELDEGTRSELRKRFLQNLVQESGRRSGMQSATTSSPQGAGGDGGSGEEGGLSVSGVEIKGSVNLGVENKNEISLVSINLGGGDGGGEGGGGKKGTASATAGFDVVNCGSDQTMTVGVTGTSTITVYAWQSQDERSKQENQFVETLKRATLNAAKDAALQRGRNAKCAGPCANDAGTCPDQPAVFVGSPKVIRTSHEDDNGVAWWRVRTTWTIEAHCNVRVDCHCSNIPDPN